MTSRFRKLAARLLATTCFAGPLSAGPLVGPQPAYDSSFVPARVADLFDDAAQQCGPVTGGALNPAIEQQIQDFRRVINQSQTGRDLMAAAADYEEGQPAWMCFSDTGKAHARYYHRRGVLHLSPGKARDKIVGDAAHELRHLFQEKMGLFAIDAATDADRIHAEYAGEADAEATAALVLWELKEAGIAGPWSYHNDHVYYDAESICYAHISTSFKHAIDNGADAPVAAQHAFRAWYRDRDLLKYYKNALLKKIRPAPDSSAAPQQPATPPATATPLPSHCDVPDPERRKRHYELPTDEAARAIEGGVGLLPSYHTNFVEQGGGLKAILQGP